MLQDNEEVLEQRKNLLKVFRIADQSIEDPLKIEEYDGTVDQGGNNEK